MSFSGVPLQQCFLLKEKCSTANRTVHEFRPPSRTLRFLLLFLFLHFNIQGVCFCCCCCLFLSNTAAKSMKRARRKGNYACLGYVGRQHRISFLWSQNEQNKEGTQEYRKAYKQWEKRECSISCQGDRKSYVINQTNKRGKKKKENIPGFVRRWQRR